MHYVYRPHHNVHFCHRFAHSFGHGQFLLFSFLNILFFVFACSGYFPVHIIFTQTTGALLQCTISLRINEVFLIPKKSGTLFFPFQLSSSCATLSGSSCLRVHFVRAKKKREEDLIKTRAKGKNISQPGKHNKGKIVCVGVCMCKCACMRAHTPKLISCMELLYKKAEQNGVAASPGLCGAALGCRMACNCVCVLPE